MSALLPKADIRQGNRDVRFALRKRTPLFDHLVGALEKRLRDFQPERLGSLEVDHQLEFGRCLQWQVGRLLAAQDAVDVAPRTAIWIKQILAIRCQAAVGGKLPDPRNRRQTVAHRKFGNLFAIGPGESVWRKNHTDTRPARERGKCRLDLCKFIHIRSDDIDAKLLGTGLRRSEKPLGKRACRIEQCRHVRRARSDLLEQFKPFPAHGGF
jgi:hypothetical protein